MSQPEDLIDRVLRLLMTSSKPSRRSRSRSGRRGYNRGRNPHCSAAVRSPGHSTRISLEVLAVVPTTLPDPIPFERWPRVRSLSACAEGQGVSSDPTG